MLVVLFLFDRIETLGARAARPARERDANEADTESEERT